MSKYQDWLIRHIQDNPDLSGRSGIATKFSLFSGSRWKTSAFPVPRQGWNGASRCRSMINMSPMYGLMPLLITSQRLVILMVKILKNSGRRPST